MMTIEEAISTFEGCIAWLPQRGIGTFLTVEFGSPVLITREPILRPGVHDSLRRRRVTVSGDKHLWVQADHWVLKSDAWTVAASDDPALITKQLNVIAGQRLLKVDVSDSGTNFSFEYGESLFVRADDDPEQVQWSIFWRNQGNASLLNGGRVKVENNLDLLAT